jgi:hypothetical protein
MNGLFNIDKIKAYSPEDFVLQASQWEKHSDKIGLFEVADISVNIAPT